MENAPQVNSLNKLKSQTQKNALCRFIEDKLFFADKYYDGIVVLTFLSRRT